ncbi:MAG: class II aldolase/adducin family protein [Spirochaetales bacterium]|nr:class II aldolase/adducin family protein [Spirochaetales bacterium]
MFPTELEARGEIAHYSRKVHAHGLVSATDGNLSIRLDDEHILITPSSIRKEDMTSEAPVIVTMDGELASGGRRPSTEVKVHLEAYRRRGDVKAVIHAHPPKAIAFTIADAPLDTCVLPEVVVTLGDVPVAPYAAPSTDELPASMSDLIRHSDVVMLARHGSVTVGPTLGDAFKKLEKLEHNAEILIYARILGGATPFSTGQLEELQNLRTFYGVTTTVNACARRADAASSSPSCRKNEGAREPRAPTYRRSREASTPGAGSGGVSLRESAPPEAMDIDVDALVDEIVARVRARL